DIVPNFVELVGAQSGAIDPNGVATIHVRDSQTQTSIVGIPVQLDFFNNTEVRIAQSQPSTEMTADCATRRLSKLTDINGNARVHILGGAAPNFTGCPNPDGNPAHTGFALFVNNAAVMSNGAQVFVKYRSFDLDGDLVVGANDLSRWN